MAQAQAQEDQEAKSEEKGQGEETKDDALEVKKDAEQPQKKGLRFGVQGMYEFGAGTNKDRPEEYSYFRAFPQMKYADFRLGLSAEFMWNHEDRMDNPWDFRDWYLQFADVDIYTESFTGIKFSGYARYYIPISKNSRLNEEYGHMRFNLKAEKTIWDLSLSAEGYYQPYFQKYTYANHPGLNDDRSSDLDGLDPESQGPSSPVPAPKGEASASSDWTGYGVESQMGYTLPNYAFSETFTIAYTPSFWKPLSDLSLSFIYSMFQTRNYELDGDETLGVEPDALWVPWSYLYNATIDLSYSVTDLYSISVGYSSFAPQLSAGGDKNTSVDISETGNKSGMETNFFDIFNPLYGSVYIDLVFQY
jgi:hypothetical protein